MNPSQITPIVLTWNEEINVARMLDTLTWAPRVIVMDSQSTDDTERIARQYPNVEFVVRKFDTLRDQWNAALDIVHTEWVLYLDCDHILSDGVIREIEALPDEPDVSGYRGHFVFKIQGRPLRGTLYPSKTVLFRLSRGRFIQDGHTHLLTLEGQVRDLKEVFYHDDRKPRDQWMEKQPGYALLEADKILGTPSDKLSLQDKVRRSGLAPIITPFYCLFAKRLILDGRAGLLYTYERTFAEAILALQILDRRLAADPDHA